MKDIFEQTISDPVLKGILDGRKAYTGPDIVQFDITNRCNNNCLCCWNNSPLGRKPTAEEIAIKEQELPLGLIKRTIDELKAINTRNLFLAGGGEPFMHPDIIEILSYAKQCGMKIFINSNFTLVDKRMAQEIVDLKVDLIHVSLLAAKASTYAVVHPNKTEESFNRIKEILRFISVLKKKKEQHLYTPLPHINLYYVIFNKNYRDIPDMVDLAMEIKADSIEITPVDIVADKTNSLLLDNEQIAYIREVIPQQLKRIEDYNINEPVKFHIEQVDNFIRRISSPLALEGRYESETITRQPCYAGWAFVRIKANGEVNPCLKASRISIGNIYEKPFQDIWNGAAASMFREKSFKLDFNDPYLQNIGDGSGCLKSCDNLHINIELNNRYQEVLRKYGRI